MPPAPGNDPAANVNSPTTLRERVEKVIELIRPAVQSDGGDIELVKVRDDGVVEIRFHGDCVGCPSSGMTLKGGIEQNVKAKVPEIREVVAVR
jgi:Fe-S cluster biogenesis protein NfuA